MTRIPARMLLQIILVIPLGAVPRGRGLDRRRDRPLPGSGRRDARDHALRRRLLLGALREDRRAVLRADVVALAVERGGIVQLEEPFLEEILVAEHRRI